MFVSEGLCWCVTTVTAVATALINASVTATVFTKMAATHYFSLMKSNCSDFYHV